MDIKEDDDCSKEEEYDKFSAQLDNAPNLKHSS